MAAAGTFAILITVSLTNESSIRAQSPQSAARQVRLPDEAAGLDGIVRTLISAFDQADVVALGEDHWQQMDSEVRIALVRHPDFAKKVRFIVVEFGSTAQQTTLDRYIQGEDVPVAELEKVWKTTISASTGVWDSPMYADFLAVVRDVNRKLPADARIRVLAGDPPVGSGMPRDASALSVLKAQVLEKRGKALVIYGAAHFYRTEVADILASVGGGIVKTLEKDYPGRTLVVIPVGARFDLPPGVTMRVNPDYQKFDRALQTQVRPVLVSLRRPPFRDFTAEEFLGHGMLNCLGAGGCVSAFQGSRVTLGQLADACLYTAR